MLPKLELFTKEEKVASIVKFTILDKTCYKLVFVNEIT